MLSLLGEYDGHYGYGVQVILDLERLVGITYRATAYAILATSICVDNIICNDVVTSLESVCRTTYDICRLTIAIV